MTLLARGVPSFTPQQGALSDYLPGRVPLPDKSEDFEGISTPSGAAFPVHGKQGVVFPYEGVVDCPGSGDRTRYGLRWDYLGSSSFTVGEDSLTLSVRMATGTVVLVLRRLPEASSYRALLGKFSRIRPACPFRSPALFRIFLPHGNISGNFSGRW